jgi:hypothetical protein
VINYFMSLNHLKSVCSRPSSWSANPIFVYFPLLNWVNHKARTFTFLYIPYLIVSSCATICFLLSFSSALLHSFGWAFD